MIFDGAGSGDFESPLFASLGLVVNLIFCDLKSQDPIAGLLKKCCGLLNHVKTMHDKL